MSLANVSLGELEREVLELLWCEARPLAPGDVASALGGTLAYTTVMIVRVRLHEKGVVRRARDGRASLYEPCIARDAFVAGRALEALRSGGRSPDRGPLLAFLDSAEKGGSGDHRAPLGSHRRASAEDDGMTSLEPLVVSDAPSAGCGARSTQRLDARSPTTRPRSRSSRSSSRQGEPGNEIQAPMPAVILGGLTSSTRLDLFVIPALFFGFSGVARDAL